jgi:hypothetical protein
MPPYNRTPPTTGLRGGSAVDDGRRLVVALIRLIHRLKRNIEIREIVCA